MNINNLPAMLISPLSSCCLLETTVGDVNDVKHTKKITQAKTSLKSILVRLKLDFCKHIMFYYKILFCFKHIYLFRP